MKTRRRTGPNRAGPDRAGSDRTGPGSWPSHLRCDELDADASLSERHMLSESTQSVGYVALHHSTLGTVR